MGDPMEKYKKELEILETEIKERTENRDLLRQVVENNTIEAFETILEIVEVKRIFSEGEADGMLCIAEDRSYYEVKTENATFLIMVDFLDMKEEVIEKFFYFYTDLYQLCAPQMEKKHIETILTFVLNCLEKDRDADSHSIQILNPYQKDFKEKKFSSEEKKTLQALAIRKQKDYDEQVKKFYEELS